jgi:hypothetical protein
MIHMKRPESIGEIKILSLTDAGLRVSGQIAGAGYFIFTKYRK